MSYISDLHTYPNMSCEFFCHRLLLVNYKKKLFKKKKSNRDSMSASSRSWQPNKNAGVSKTRKCNHRYFVIIRLF